MTPVETDLIIAGGGLAGASLALAVSRLVPELRVTVVENHPLAPDAAPDDYQPSYDARSTALAWGSRLIFEQLGLWPALSEHATPIRHIHVSDRGRFGATRPARRGPPTGCLGLCRRQPLDGPVPGRGSAGDTGALAGAGRGAWAGARPRRALP